MSWVKKNLRCVRETKKRNHVYIGDGEDIEKRGLQFFITDHFSIDSTYRHVWLERLGSRNENLEDKTFNDNGHMVTIGLNVHF